jgi:hypothetical protein
MPDHMSKRRRQKRKNSKNQRSELKQVGIDYGCLPYSMAVGSLDFPRHLSAAKVIGVAYGWAYSDTLGRTVPLVSLVAENADELATAFKMFNAWSTATDPDAVDITFAFRKAGGYVLAISPEHSRLEQRYTGFDRTFRFVGLTATWFKSLDSVNPALLEFRKYCSAILAPFLFDGAIYPTAGPPLSASSRPRLQSIPGLLPLLKFNVSFVDEDSVEANTLGWLALHLQDQRSGSHAPKSRPIPTSAEIAKHRFKMLTCHFPVTLERIRRSSEIRELARRFERDGIREWQVEQAICNLVLKLEMPPAHDRNVLKGSRVSDPLLQALGGRFEIADQRDLPVFTDDHVQQQVVDDGVALLDFIGRKVPSTRSTVQEALGSASALDGISVLADFQRNASAAN